MTQYRGGKKMFGGELNSLGAEPNGWFCTAGKLIGAMHDLIEAGVLHASLKLVRLADNAEIKVACGAVLRPRPAVQCNVLVYAADRVRSILA
jgi:hypothetical protein